MSEQDPVLQYLKGNPFAARDGIDSDFEELVLSEVNHNLSKNDLYSNFMLSILGKTEMLSFENLPAIPAQAFKVLGTKLSSAPESDIRFNMASSATSGHPSVVPIDAITAKRQSLAMSSVISSFIGSERRPFLVVDADPKRRTSQQMGARDAATMGYLRFASEAVYLMEEDKFGVLRLLPTAEEIISKLVKENESPPVMFGFTYVLHQSLVTNLIETNKKLCLPEDSTLIHIGGWKKLESQKITSAMFKEHVSSTLGINSRNIFDVYGFTEQMGLNYVECEFGYKHVPCFSQLRVIDPSTGLPTEFERIGALEFTSPVAHSYPGNRVLTDDLGILSHLETCECGRSGQKFQIVGRRPRAEVRGCGDILGSRLQQEVQRSEIATDELRLKIQYSTNWDPSSNLGDANSTLSNLIKLTDKAKNQLNELRVDEIISILEALSLSWDLDKQEYAQFRNNGLGFLKEWMSAANLRAISNRGLLGNRLAMDRFVSQAGTQGKTVRGVSRGPVAQWVSGNVPMLGMFSLCLALISKSPCLIRVSSTGIDMMSQLIKGLEEIEVSYPSGKVISGKLLADAVLVVSFDRNDLELHQLLSLGSKTRIMWGGLQAVSAVHELPSQLGTRDLVFGPRTSLAVVDDASLRRTGAVKRIARRFAADATVFNQIACASPHTIFVITEDQEIVDKFSLELDLQMGNASERFGIEVPEEGLANEIRLKRTLSLFQGRFLGPVDLTHTINVGETEVLPEPVFGRTVNVVPVRHFTEVTSKLTEEVQTIGTELTEPMYSAFIEAASLSGAQRFPPIGKMTNFDDPWDGTMILSELVRWVSTGSST